MDVEYTDPPAPAQRLDPAGAARAPREAGVYAAWLVDDESLAELGVHGQAPFLLYLGKAGGRGGLRERLRRHASVPWLAVTDMLAAQSRILPDWWAYADKVKPRRVPPVPPLAQVAVDAALAWQREQIVWGWQTTSPSLVAARESALIATHTTLLNRRGRGYVKHGPPQLRCIGPNAPQRAWWLFHVAWIAVLQQQPHGWARRELRGTRVASDESGWPVQLGLGREHVVKVPTERSARRS